MSSIFLVLFIVDCSAFGAAEVIHEQTNDHHQRKKGAKDRKDEVPEQGPRMALRKEKLLLEPVSPVKILIVAHQVMVEARVRFNYLSRFIVGFEEFVQILLPGHKSHHVFVPQAVLGNPRPALKRQCGTSSIVDSIQEAFVRVKCESSLEEHHLMEATVFDKPDARQTQMINVECLLEQLPIPMRNINVAYSDIVSPLMKQLHVCVHPLVFIFKALFQIILVC